MNAVGGDLHAGDAAKFWRDIQRAHEEDGFAGPGGFVGLASELALPKDVALD